MTCIIGLVDQTTKKVYIGGDSAGVSGTYVSIRADSKVFRNGPFLMGFTSSYRMGQLLRYVFTPPEHHSDIDNMKYMVSVFIPQIKKCFKDGGFQKSNDSVEEGGCFLVAYREALYEIDSDYQVGRLSDNVSSVGCGSKVALGAMYALESLPPLVRIKRALEITTHLNNGVRPPFIIEEL